MGLLQVCRKYRTIYLYGDGEIGRLVRIYLDENEICVSAFLTTNTPCEEYLLDIPVYPLGMNNNENDIPLIVICMNQSGWNTAIKRLQENGYSDYFVVDDTLKKQIFTKTCFDKIYSTDLDKKEICVLMYHRIENMRDPFNIIVSPENFESHLQYYMSNYNIIDCNCDWNENSKNSIAITFDDGYVDFYKYAYPLLKKYNVPATVFVSTGNIENGGMFWWDELEQLVYCGDFPEKVRIHNSLIYKKDYPNRKTLLLSIRTMILQLESDIRELVMSDLKSQINAPCIKRMRDRTMTKEEIAEIAKDPLITVGAHTISHVLCDKEKENRLEKEIMISKKYLEELTDTSVKLFAYPNGNYSDLAKGILIHNGFSKAYTCVHSVVRFDSDSYALPRCGVSNWNYKQIGSAIRGILQTCK